MPGDKNKKDGKDAKVEPKGPLGPDGKPIPFEKLTETQQVQIQIENTASEVLICFFLLSS